jgi:hypothetical protein
MQEHFDVETMGMWRPDDIIARLVKIIRVSNHILVAGADILNGHL